MQILKNMAFKTRLPSLPVRWQIRHNDFKTFPYIQFLGKAAKFDGHSLNGFEVIHLSERGEVKCPPGQTMEMKWRSLFFSFPRAIFREKSTEMDDKNCQYHNDVQSAL